MRFVLLSCLLFLSCTKIPNKNIVLKVGDRFWTFQEVHDYFSFRLNKTPLEKKNEEDLKKEFLNELILRSLVENWAKKNKIQAKKKVLTKEEKRAAKDPAFRRFLKDYKNFASLQEALGQELLKNTEPPSLKEQKSFYRKNSSQFLLPESCRLKQIVVEKEKFALSLKKRLAQGESFDTLNQLYSLQKHPGWVKKGDLPIFDKVCFEQRRSKNSISPVLKSPYGYHIFRIEQRKGRGKKSFQQVQAQIIRFLRESSAKEQFQVWLKGEIHKTQVWTNKKLLEKIHIQYKTNSS